MVGTDKSAELLALYEPFIAPRRSHVRAVVELGIASGASLHLWARLFPFARILGIDENCRDADMPESRIVVRRCAQQDVATLAAVVAAFAPEGVDVIIDDASHVGQYAKASFWALFPDHLKPGGLYAVEDWGTGYWDHWPDGAVPAHLSREPARLDGHQAGMVGFLKQLVDEVGIEDATRAAIGRPPRVKRVVAALHVLPGLAIALKAE